jgi:hypothetical protein
VLDSARLMGALLEGADLRGASLNNADLTGASLKGADLHGASLNHAQLQGALLDGAQLQGASLRGDYVWRTYPPSNATGAFVEAPEPGPKYSPSYAYSRDDNAKFDCRWHCDWSEASYTMLKSMLEDYVSAGWQRDLVLQRIAALEKPPYVTDEASAKAWTDLAVSSLSTSSYFSALAKTLKEIGCAANGAPYVIGGLIRQLYNRFEGSPAQLGEVAAAFLDEKQCPGARGLSENGKAQLREIPDSLPAPTGPGTAAR